MYDKFNEPEAFDRMTPVAQATQWAWIRMALAPTRTVRGGSCNHSYALKHVAEEDIGNYVSNGELRGTMMAERYDFEIVYGGLNWRFNSIRRRPTVEEIVIFEGVCASLREEEAERRAARRERAG